MRAIAALFCLLAYAAAPDAHLRISGTTFLTADGQPFQWRGISAFRLVEFVARGEHAKADAYLAWVAKKQLTVVRVFVMADNLFKLSAEDGRRALPALLDLARQRGLYVEVVALADTATLKIDIAAHVKAIAEICAKYPNTLLEIANEPGHPTQDRRLHDPAYVRSLASAIPASVPYALGSVEYDDGFAAGQYVTWHAPRSGKNGWPAEIAQGAALREKYRKPVVSDEPIGAADRLVPGRRDNSPARFRQSGINSRRAGIGATFHYEGGLQARLPSRVELACLDAWLAGLRSSGTGQQRRLGDGGADGGEERVRERLVAGGTQVQSVDVDILRLVSEER